MAGMPIQGNYEPGSWDWANDQVATIEASGGTEGLELQGKQVFVLWTKGRKSGAVRKAPLMRVEHDGRYAAVASKGGDPKHPEWYLNLLADPHVTIQDGPEVRDFVGRVLEGDERAEWWTRAAEFWPAYDDYQTKTDRLIPVVLLEPVE
jgi:deazaflavin-dependent oxidoreductase (nitroreductase family)